VAHTCNPSYSGGREIRRIVVRSQPGQIVRDSLSQKKNPSQKKAGGVAQDVGPEYKPQYNQEKKNSNPSTTKKKNFFGMGAGQNWHLNSGPCICEAGALPLQPWPSLQNKNILE
jgi:hypothetical protein